ncbi:MAG TPA: nucleotide exchange factor GrpE, partial [bacterium]|nr:nucleotide exchange factor GrpE [bacterium]
MPDRQKARKWKMNAGGNGYRPDQVAPDGALPPGEEEPMLPGASPHRPEGNVFVDPPHMTPAEELSYAAEEMEKESVLETECPDPFQVLQSDLEAALRDLAKERASFANYRQRIDKEKEEIRRYGGLELARDLVRVLDYFQMSLQFDAPDLPPAAQNLMQGVQYTVGE